MVKVNLVFWGDPYEDKTCAVNQIIGHKANNCIFKIYQSCFGDQEPGKDVLDIDIVRSRFYSIYKNTSRISTVFLDKNLNFHESIRHSQYTIKYVTRETSSTSADHFKDIIGYPASLDIKKFDLYSICDEMINDDQNTISPNTKESDSSSKHGKEINKLGNAFSEFKKFFSEGYRKL